MHQRRSLLTPSPPSILASLCSPPHQNCSLAFLRPYNSTSTTVSSNVLAEGEKCELPLWACISLALESRFFDMQLPKHYGDSFRKKLDGGGENFNLRIKSLYYYEVGELLCSRIKRIPTSRRGTDNSECRSGERRVEAFKIRVLAANNLLIPPLPSSSSTLPQSQG